MAEPEQATPTSPDPASKLGVSLLIGGFVLLALIGAYQVLPARPGDDLTVGIADHQATAVRDSRKAPTFTLPDLATNEPMSLSDFRGRIVVLNFWASWCLPCRQEAVGLEATWQAHRGRGVQFVGSNYLDDRDATRAFVDEFRITYPSVFDPSGSLAARYAFLGLPSTFVIDRSQRIRMQFTGYVRAAQLRRTLDQLLQEVYR